MMDSGKYWIGDLCYVFSEEEWDEFCAITMPDNECLDGEFKFRDGRTFSFRRTKNGDGVYRDEDGNKYCVDAGLIGCIRVEDISGSVDDKSKKLGHIFDMDQRFRVYGYADDDDWDGIIRFGDQVHIYTDP